MGERISERVIACAYSVSRELGPGFLEAVYENALCFELSRDGLHVERQKQLDVMYKGDVVGRYVADIIVEKRLLLELKAVPKLVPAHKAQVINYLKAIGVSVALLVNYGTPKPEIRRVVWRYDEEENI